MNKYQWPADKLTEEEMAILYRWRQRTKIPIKQLLAQTILLMDKIVNDELCAVKIIVVHHAPSGFKINCAISSARTPWKISLTSVVSKKIKKLS